MIARGHRLQVAALRESLPKSLGYSPVLNLADARTLVTRLSDREVLRSADDLQAIAPNSDPAAAMQTLQALVARPEAEAS
ncbi:MAG: hypothetical protein JWP32_328 [Schumannella sp.]|nr:hypothetical protein [Schumannella sp.]